MASKMKIQDEKARDFFESGERAEDARNFSGAADWYEAASLRLMLVGYGPSDPLVRKISKDSLACRKLS